MLSFLYGHLIVLNRIILWLVSLLSLFVIASWRLLCVPSAFALPERLFVALLTRLIVLQRTISCFATPTIFPFTISVILTRILVLSPLWNLALMFCLTVLLPVVKRSNIMEFTVLELQWLRRAISNQMKVVARQRDAEYDGSEVRAIRVRELDQLSSILVKLGA